MSTNYVHGHDAEHVAADYLRARQYNIVALNWKTRWCEIDIVAEKDDYVFLIEVKYRKTTWQGTGFDYITPQKIRQMQFAAEFWITNNAWTGDYQLAAIEISGDHYEVTGFVDGIILN